MDNELQSVMKLLDRIITSKRPETVTAFRELLTIAALTESGNGVAGPLEKLLDKVEALETKVAVLDMVRATPSYPPSERQPWTGSYPDITTPYPSIPDITYPSQPWSGYGGTGGTTTTGGSIGKNPYNGNDNIYYQATHEEGNVTYVHPWNREV